MDRVLMTFAIMFVLFGVVGFLFIGPYLVTSGLKKIEDGESLSFKDKLLCSIPILNTFIADNTYNGSLWIGFLNTLGYLGIGFRLFLIFTSNPNLQLHVISLGVMFILLLISYLANVCFVYSILKNMGNEDTLSIFYMFIFSVFYVIGQVYIGTTLVKQCLYEESKAAKYN